MEKVCVDCGKVFTAGNRAIRCKECQKRYRKKYNKKYDTKKYWNQYPTNSHQSKYYKFARFAETLSDDELSALVSKYVRDMKLVSEGKKREYRTYIKILQTEYSNRIGDRILARADSLDEEIERRSVE